MNRCLIGDCRESMRALIAEGVRVQTCVTSPPYWGLRDYGHAGQLGLEATPEEYVERMVDVFGLVRELLADDGTLWINLGDSYANDGKWGGATGGKHVAALHGSPVGRGKRATGLKPKDLVGIPWRVAFALQQPRYTGSISRVEDRIWLACAIDAEGCIFVHKRKEGQSNGQGYERKNASYGAGLEVANTSEAFVERCLQIAGAGSICHQDGGRKQRLYRWNLRSNECRKVLQEVYPYLVAKQQQARLAIGCPSSGDAASAAHEALIGLHGGQLSDIDFPAPGSMYQPGFYLRQDVIWSKLNPMPESVTDRCTKSHEYLFLLAKSERYFFNAAAIKEPRASTNYAGVAGWAAGPGDHSSLGHNRTKDKGDAKTFRGGQYVNGNKFANSHATQRDSSGNAPAQTDERNRRSVWTVATTPYSGAHFATFPPALIEPCILAGSRPGDVVFDPFFGSGTTGMVAERLGRRWLGCELNPEYEPLQRERTAQIGLSA